MSGEMVIDSVKKTIKKNGLKICFVSKETGIGYQRLSRILNRNVAMTVDEFVILCKFAKINIQDLIDQAV